MYYEDDMSSLKELRLRIEGTVDGVEMTPETMPMSRLVEYLTDLVAIMGHKDAVHLMRVEEGSTMPVLYIHSDEESRITSRIQEAQKGTSVKEANLAYKRFDNRLREDQAVAEIVNIERGAKIIEFPGRNVAMPQEYAQIREAGELIGEVRRVGGLDETVPIWLRRSDGEVFYCEADEIIAKDLAHHLYKTLRVYGVGTWNRNNEGVWKLEKFRIRSFDPEQLSNATFTDTLNELKAIPNNAWVTMADPLAEVRAIRDGEKSESA